MNLRRVLAQIAFAFLLLSQQAGITHAISHIASESSGSTSKKQLPAELQCDQCLAFAALGAGLVGSPSPAPAALAPIEISLPALPPGPRLPVFRAFDSRAPPALS